MFAGVGFSDILEASVMLILVGLVLTHADQFSQVITSFGSAYSSMVQTLMKPANP